MFMRYLGNGIGHRATNHFEPTASNEHLTRMDEDDDTDPERDLAFKNRDISDTDDEVNDEEDDYGYNHNQLIMADGCEEDEEEEDEWESMYVDE